MPKKRTRKSQRSKKGQKGRAQSAKKSKTRRAVRAAVGLAGLAALNIYAARRRASAAKKQAAANRALSAAKKRQRRRNVMLGFGTAGALVGGLLTLKIGKKQITVPPVRVPSGNYHIRESGEKIDGIPAFVLIPEITIHEPLPEFGYIVPSRKLKAEVDRLFEVIESDKIEGAKFELKEYWED